jgi:membrane-associated phospholipid phosphatase
MAVGPLTPLDRATLAYVAFALAATAVPGRARPPMMGLLVVGLLLVAFLAGVLAPRVRRAGPAGQFLGEFYPLILTLALYTEIGLVNRARGVSHDAAVQAWERTLFGGQPALEWIRAWPSPLFSTVMHLAYLFYYVILAGAPLGLWLSGRRDAARRALFLMMATFYTCYALFFLFPVAGPRYLFPLARNAATATPVAAFTHRLVAGGSAWGTAFPSSHVAAALVAAVCAWLGWRSLGAVLVPAALLLALGTVYGQFHYAVDALGGAAVAAVALALGCGYHYAPRTHEPRPAGTE